MGILVTLLLTFNLHNQGHLHCQSTKHRYLSGSSYRESSTGFVNYVPNYCTNYITDPKLY